MPDNDGFLRISGSAPFLGSGTRGSGDSRAAAYLENLVKMIPGEVLAFYPVEKLLKIGDPWPDFRAWPVMCLIVLIVFRIKATAKSGTWIPQLLPLIVSIGSFILWIYLTGDYFLYWKATGASKVLLSYAGLLWPLVWSGFVSGDPKRPPRG